MDKSQNLITENKNNQILITNQNLRIYDEKWRNNVKIRKKILTKNKKKKVIYKTAGSRSKIDSRSCDELFEDIFCSDEELVTLFVRLQQLQGENSIVLSPLCEKWITLIFIWNLAFWITLLLSKMLQASKPNGLISIISSEAFIPQGIFWYLMYYFLVW